MRVVLTGTSGQLGAYLADRLAASGHELRAWSGRENGTRGGHALRPVDLTDAGATDRALAEDDPGAIVHAAAISTADAAYRDPSRARAVNVEATGRLADWCRLRDRRLVFPSTDLVFDGSGSWYREDDDARPVLAYGRTKREAEPAVLAVPRGMVARLSLLYGPAREGRATSFDRTVAGLRAGRPQTFFEDEFRTALDYATAAAILARLVSSDATGLLHVAGRERVSRYELARRVAAALGLDARLVRANRQADSATPEPRPADVSLETSRLDALFPDLARPTIEEAVTGALAVSTGDAIRETKNRGARWDETGLGRISLEGIRSLHRPHGHFRISPSIYGAGTVFSGSSRARRFYVIKGACTIDMGNETWELNAGDVVELPPGDYGFRVIGSSSVEVVSVWELPEPFWADEST